MTTANTTTRDWVEQKLISSNIGRKEDDQPSEDEGGYEGGGEHFETFTDLKDYPFREEGMDPELAMFLIKEDKKHMWPKHSRPDVPGFVAIDAQTAFQLHNFLMKGGGGLPTIWKPVSLPPSCYSYINSLIAPFRGLMMNVYSTTWAGLPHSPNMECLASRFETMKLILAASAIYQFVHSLPIEPTNLEEGDDTLVDGDDNDYASTMGYRDQAQKLANACSRMGPSRRQSIPRGVLLCTQPTYRRSQNRTLRLQETMLDSWKATWF